MNLAAQIAALRKARGMTQEVLAEKIGVSSQTVSKWENAVTYPDVLLLPALADVFDVTIEALYGRESGCPDVSAQIAFEAVIEAVRETIVAAIHMPEMDGAFDEHLAKYKKAMQTDARHRSVIENDRDVLYFREETGALALRKPEEGWSSLFARKENLEVLQLLADADFRRAMLVIISRRMLSFTIPTIVKESGAENAQRLEELLQSSGLFAKRELLIDEKTLVYYELTGGECKLFLLYAVLIFAQELRTHESVHYCFIGNNQFYTP